jgi:hypothetical protein
VAGSIVRAQSASNTKSISFTAPTAGNVIIGFCSTQGGTSNTSPAGYTEIRNYLNTNPPQVALAYKISDGTETGFSFGGNGVRPVVFFLEVSDVDMSALVHGLSVEFSSSDTVVTSTITSPADDSLALLFLGWRPTSATARTPDAEEDNSFTRVISDRATNSGGAWPIGVVSEGPSLFASGASITGGYTLTGGESGRMSLISLALPPAVPGGGLPSGVQATRILVGGSWELAVPYVLVGGSWEIATPKILSGGAWVDTTDVTP